MTRQLEFKENGTPFGAWLRVQPDIDSRKYKLNVQDVDYIIHTYKWPGYEAMMLIEEKRYGGKSSFAQTAARSIIDQALWMADGKTVVNHNNKKVRFRYYGYHLLVFEYTTPDDGKMWWNGKLINRSQLISLLRYDIDPRNYAMQKNG